MRRLFALGIALLMGLAANASAEKPFTVSDVPSPLKAWVPWVMHDSQHNNCPFIANAFDQKVCVWPTLLSLDLSGTGGGFTYKLTVYDQPDKKPQRIDLPGQPDLWPQNVKIDGKPAVVLPDDETPGLMLAAGEYTVTGNYLWEKMPGSLRIPQSVGLVRLTLNKQEVPIPDMESGQLWIQRSSEQGETVQENRLEARVFRKVTDSIPLSIETSIQLQVAGRQREEELGRILPDGFIATGIESDLPARLESNGTLRVQLRPGSYDIRVSARSESQVSSLVMPVSTGVLPKQEIWSFEAQNQLRLVTIEGVNSIDPAQSELPAEWRQFPAYLMKEGSHFTLAQKKRGVADTVPDQLSLSRNIWVDFSGKGYTFKDSIYGTIHQSSRLEVADGIELGDAAINGKSQYITTIPVDGAKSNPGIEVREGAINLTAGSRIESGAGQFPAGGWKSNFDRMDAHLYLPPGWTLFSYSGVDKVSQSWVGSWTLLDVFFVMLAFVAVTKLFDVRIAVVATLALVLIQHELPGFTTLVLLVLAGMAVLRYLPEGRFRTGVIWAQRVVLLFVFCIALPFMVGHLRLAIYPQLKPAQVGYGNTVGILASEPMTPREQAFGAGSNGMATDAATGEMAITPGSLPTPAPVMQMAPRIAGRMAQKPAYAKAFHARTRVPAMLKSVSSAAVSSLPLEENYQSYAPDTKVQTGFGNANWYNNAITLSWNGTVDSSVKLSLWLLSARENLVLAVLRVLLMGWLLVLLLGKPFRFWKEKIGWHSGAAAVLVLCMSLASPFDARAQNEENIAKTAPLSTDLVYPPQYMLRELKGKLERSQNEPPSCLPSCVSVSRSYIGVANDTLTLLQEVHVKENVAVPLAGGAANWRPSTVLVNDKSAASLTLGQDGYLYVNLTTGVYDIKLVGALPFARDTVGISLPLPSHYTTSDARGWSVQGVHENGLTDNSIQLIRTDKHVAQAEKSFARTSILPFFQLERTFTLNQQWQVTTILHRITPTGEPAAADVPLLPGETITTPGMQIKNGKVFASFDPGSTEVRWNSVITPQPTIKLTAAKDVPWVEIWRVSVSNLWHAQASGIPRVYFSDPASSVVNTAMVNAGGFWQWQPWPGEEVNIAITRPVGVEGDTRTIDESSLNITPGQRSVDMNLSLSIRSSLGGQHELTLPDGAVLLEVRQGGQVLPVQLKQNLLTLPLSPGVNAFSVHWKHNDALPDMFRVPPIGLGLKRSVNATTIIDMPQDRWILLARGPQMGPAVLFWSWIPVILLLAFGLGRIPGSPLKMGAWFLLLLGLNQAGLGADFIIIAWLLALEGRKKLAGLNVSKEKFNIAQVLLVFLTVIGLCLLFESIRAGLLGSPDMRVVGNGSYGWHLQWYQDITGSRLPRVMVLSLPTWVYRVLMLLWSLWLAFSLVSWLRSGWRNFTDGGYWRKSEIVPK